MYLVVLDNYNEPKDIDKIRTFVDIKGAQYKVDKTQKITKRETHDLKRCQRLDNTTISNLTIAEEDALFTQKPYCIDKFYNYTI